MLHFIPRHGGGQTWRYRRHVEFRRYSRWEGKPGLPPRARGNLRSFRWEGRLAGLPPRYRGTLTSPWEGTPNGARQYGGPFSFQGLQSR